MPISISFGHTLMALRQVDLRLSGSDTIKAKLNCISAISLRFADSVPQSKRLLFFDLSYHSCNQQNLNKMAGLSYMFQVS